MLGEQTKMWLVRSICKDDTDVTHVAGKESSTWVQQAAWQSANSSQQAIGLLAANTAASRLPVQWAVTDESHMLLLLAVQEGSYLCRLQRPRTSTAVHHLFQLEGGITLQACCRVITLDKSGKKWLSGLHGMYWMPSKPVDPGLYSPVIPMMTELSTYTGYAGSCKR